MRTPSPRSRVPGTRFQLVSFLALWLLFAVLFHLAVDEHLDAGSGHAAGVWAATGFAFAGPFVGTIARGLDCCGDNALFLFAWSGPVLVAAIAAQFALPRDGRGWALLRGALWLLGWVAWYGSGVVSLAVALE